MTFREIEYKHPDDKIRSASRWTWNANRQQAIEFLNNSPDSSLFVIIDRFNIEEEK